MTAKHTPIYAVEAGRTITRDGEPFVSLSRCLKPKERGGGGYFSPVECDDFTRLAALAPEMLDALREVVQDWQDESAGTHETAERARSLIARAEGRSE